MQEAAVNDYCATGLNVDLLPEDVLIRISEVCIGMRIMVDYNKGLDASRVHKFPKSHLKFSLQTLS